MNLMSSVQKNPIVLLGDFLICEAQMVPFHLFNLHGNGCFFGGQL